MNSVIIKIGNFKKELHKSHIDFKCIAYDNHIEISHPIFRALSITNIKLTRNSTLQHPDYEIIDYENIHLNWNHGIDENDCLVFEIKYNQIREYNSIFYKLKTETQENIDNSSEVLMKNLGKIYQESEEAYKNSMWLAYISLCGAVAEGFLSGLINKTEPKKNIPHKFEETINLIFNNPEYAKHLNKTPKNLINELKNGRNKIHAFKFFDKKLEIRNEDEYTNITTAKDMFHTISQLLCLSKINL
jgi:hypothetical protein